MLDRLFNIFIALIAMLGGAASFVSGDTKEAALWLIVFLLVRESDKRRNQ